MSNDISDDLGRILAYAREEAARTGSLHIMVDHLMLGLLRCAPCHASCILEELAVDLDAFKRHIDSELVRDEGVPYSDMDSIELSGLARYILRLCYREASSLGCEQSSSEHLLLAISRQEHCVSQPYLLAHGITHSKILERMQEGSKVRVTTISHSHSSETLAILEYLRSRYEDYHQVVYTEEALEACVRLSECYLGGRGREQSAIEAMDEAGLAAHLGLLSPLQEHPIEDSDDGPTRPIVDASTVALAVSMIMDSNNSNI